MKNIVYLLLFLLVATATNAQVFNSKSLPSNPSTGRGTYGTYQAFNYQTGTICTIISNTVTPMPASRAADTLKVPVVNASGYNTDSGYVQFSFNGNYDMVFDLAITKVSGTLAGTAVLQGSTDNATWHTLTGNTTYCTDCIGASATITNTTGTKHYQWYMPHSATTYPYYQLFPLLSGTCTATFTGSAGYKY